MLGCVERLVEYPEVNCVQICVVEVGRARTDLGLDYAEEENVECKEENKGFG